MDTAGSHARSSTSKGAAEQQLGRADTRATTSTHKHAQWWQIRWGRGMVNDVRRRAPFYASDFSDAWDYRVVPATVYMYFAKYVGA